MRLDSLRSIVKAAVLGASVLLLGAGIASAQQQINLTATTSTITLPDGSSVPMWGYVCGALAAGSTAKRRAGHQLRTAVRELLSQRKAGAKSPWVFPSKRKK